MEPVQNESQKKREDGCLGTREHDIRQGARIAWIVLALAALVREG
jgi:hypothetical protein